MQKDVHVLIIEDNEDDAILEIDELIRGGFQVSYRQIQTRNELAEALRQDRWDCIISDFSMPQFSGLEALDVVRNSELDIPFILVSGAVGEETAVAAMKAGAHDYIMKNNMTRLVPALERELREAEVRQQNRIAEETILNEREKRIREIEKFNAELIAAKNKAEEADKLKSSFLANMSHEIRTPLNAILGFSSLLKKPNLSPEKTSSFVDIIDSSGQQLLAIINDILDISKIEAGQISISMGPVNIHEVMNELLQQFEKQAEQKNIGLKLQIDLSRADPEVETDEIRLRQIISNLLSNAIKFTHHGSVVFGVHKIDHFLEFFVKDEGIGISEEDQAIIFEPFRQVETNNARVYGGNGLGLSISRALVEKLGGSISVYSELGKGSLFNFTIPGNQTQPDEPLEENIPEENSWSRHIILIAEDECFNYLYLEEILAPTGVKIIHARDGKEAVELVKKYPVSLVLMDIKMPVMDGYTATRLIKSLKPELPVIAQSAYISGDKKKNSKAGFDHFLTKPIGQDNIIKVLADYIE